MQLQHTATHCNCNILQTATRLDISHGCCHEHSTSHCNTLATYRNTLQLQQNAHGNTLATYRNTLQLQQNAHCNTLATYRNTLQLQQTAHCITPHTATHHTPHTATHHTLQHTTHLRARAGEAHRHVP
jgi:hypothetical protein